jgi:HEAT repeat protein
VGFEQFWQRFDQLDRDTRASAGKAMLKILPDTLTRLQRRMTTGSVEQRIKALQVARELGLSGTLAQTIGALTEHASARVRAKAVAALADSSESTGEALLNRVLNDPDPRVRASAIEVLEAAKNPRFIALLVERARVGESRERANAIKALHRMKVPAAAEMLTELLKDQRPEHRVSGLWTVRQTGMWSFLNEVSRLAKSDPNLRVRRYALGVLQGLAEVMRRQNEKSA